MKYILIITFIILTGCSPEQEQDAPVIVSPPSGDITPEIIVEDEDRLSPPSEGQATEVIIYPLQEMYLNGLRDNLDLDDTITRARWESLCVDENTTDKTYSFPLAHIDLIERVGFAVEDQTHAQYIRDTWFYGINASAQFYDENGELLFNGLDWLINQDTNIAFDFMPDDSALYNWDFKMISAGHNAGAEGNNVGTIVFNHDFDRVQAMLNTENTVEVHYYCMAF